MREIKFRAWHKAWERFMTDDEVMGYGSCFIKRELVFPTNVVLQQYTGLEDKNGKEIYEGDIVKNTLLSRRSDYGEIVEVKYSTDYPEFGGFRLAKHDTNGNPKTCYEVIGNIYETPELLKEEADAQHD